MIARSSSGLTTVMSASRTVAKRKSERYSLYGLAYEMIRRTVPGFSFCWVTVGSCLKDRIMAMFGRPYMTRETSWGRQ